MERLDIYDEKRRRLGYSLPRGVRRRAGEYTLFVGIFTVNREGELLLTRRAPEKKEWPLAWENTAGAVLTDEDTRTAAVRELYEETGITVPADTLILLGTERSKSAIGDAFLSFVSERPPITLQAGETVDYRWVSLDDLPQLMEQGALAPPVTRRLGVLYPLILRHYEARRAGIPSDETTVPPIFTSV